MKASEGVQIERWGWSQGGHLRPDAEWLGCEERRSLARPAGMCAVYGDAVSEQLGRPTGGRGPMGKLNLTQLRETPRMAVCFQISQAYFCCPSAAALKLGRWGCPASLPPPAPGAWECPCGHLQTPQELGGRHGPDDQDGLGKPAAWVLWRESRHLTWARGHQA